MTLRMDLLSFLNLYSLEENNRNKITFYKDNDKFKLGHSNFNEQNFPESISI